ncbi:MAG: hypothetical protein KAI53_03695 [Candidatus Aenigmarchaeota archaeon]|nr:hypothetical protein [Candidatus Aenigmarchaeota archaeon]
METRKCAKKGSLHIIESFIAFMIVMSFLFFIMPVITNISNTTEIKIKYLHSALDTLEKNGNLREYALCENIVGLNESIYELVPLTYNFTVGISSVNASDKSTSGNYSFNYAADTGKIDYAFLDIVFLSAEDPEIYVNGNSAFNQSGIVSGNRETIDITSSTITGENIVQFNFTGTATVDYRLLVSQTEILGDIPGGKDIIVVNYVLSGANSTFKPTEVRMYLWG